MTKKAISNIDQAVFESFCFELLHVYLKVWVELLGGINIKRRSREKNLNIYHQMLIFKSPIKFDFVIPPIRDPWNFMIPP